MKRRFNLTALLVIVSIALLLANSNIHACAQNIDQQLQLNDAYVSQQFRYFCPYDTRYNQYMNIIAQRLNSTIVDTFGEDKDLTFYVCVSPLGFNAVSFHRFMVFDSVLLDSLRYLSMGVVYYGGVDNSYVDQLAYQVARISASHRMGMSTANYYDTENPFNLPEVGTLTEEQSQRAEKLFLNMLASWVAHEGSHCMRDHMKHRYLAMQQQLNQQRNLQQQQQFFNSMGAYANARISRELEKEADEYAVRWLINSGFNVEGYITWLKFGSKLEKVMGTENAYLRTHPSCAERVQYITEEAKRYGGR